MKFLEAYSLGSGQKIDRIQITEKFYPLPFENYIIFNPISKDAKTYDYWNSVLEIILPVLEKDGIKVVQIGAAGEPEFNGCFQAVGKTNINQCAYLISKAKLVLGADSFPAHLAGHYNIPLVALYSNNYLHNCAPYFGDKSKQILLEPERNGTKPTFALKEFPKTINSIKPEKIIESVHHLLHLPYKYIFETVHFGSFYHQPRIVEVVPPQAVNTSNLGLNTVVFRMDYDFNEQSLANQLRICNCIIITNKPINLELIKNFKSRIPQFVHIIDKNSDPKFPAALVKLGINLNLITYLSNEELNPLKLDYIDIAMINQKKINYDLFKNEDISKLYYKSNKIVLAKEKIYQSRAGDLNEQPLSSFNNIFQPVINTPEFFKELDFYHIVKVRD